MLRIWTKRGFYRYFADMQDLIQLIASLDQHLLGWINGPGSTPFLDVFFPAITDLHKTWQFKFILIPALFISFVLYRRIEGVIIFIGFALSLALSDFTGGLIKHFFQRQRPFEISAEIIQRSPAGGFSFPSNHAANMFCMFFFLTVFFPKYRSLYLLIAILVSYSRIYNGVHFPSDVIAGAFWGGFCGIVGSEFTQKVIHHWNLLWKDRSRG